MRVLLPGNSGPATLAQPQTWSSGPPIPFHKAFSSLGQEKLFLLVREEPAETKPSQASYLGVSSEAVAWEIWLLPVLMLMLCRVSRLLLDPLLGLGGCWSKAERIIPAMESVAPDLESKWLLSFHMASG